MTVNYAGPADEAQLAKPLTTGKPSWPMMAVLWAFVTIPFGALVAGIPLAALWGWGPSLLDVTLLVLMYVVSIVGVGVGFHRHFTHRSFQAKRGLRVALAVAGSLSIEGNIIQWVADHRRHHEFADKEGDPHSPWRYGTSFWGLTRGLWYAHTGWLLDRELSNREKFAPDLLRDRDILRVDRAFPLLVILSIAGPTLLAGMVTWSWQGALSAFFWAGLVRIALVHHVTWSINSVCHVFGERPFQTRDHATNFWPLALLSFGECWHNLHHAVPIWARHGVLPGQIDVNARVIRLFERLGWATNVRWPKADKIAQLQSANVAG